MRSRKICSWIIIIALVTSLFSVSVSADETVVPNETNQVAEGQSDVLIDAEEPSDTEVENNDCEKTAGDLLEDDSELVSISASATQSVLQGTNGWQEEWDDNEWYYYNLWAFEPIFTVVTKSGSYTGTEGEIYAETGRCIELTSDQSENDTWGAGKHKVTATIDTVSCEFEVEIIPSAEFEKSITIDGAKVTVNAPFGVYPANAVITIEGLSDTVKKHLKDLRENYYSSEDISEVSSYAFKVSVTDGNGKMLLPEGDNQIRLSIETPEASDSNNRQYLFCQEKETDDWIWDLYSETMDGEVTTQTNLSEHVFFLEFGYERKTYSLKSGTSVAIQDILDSTGLSGTVTNAACSDAQLLSVSSEGGSWVLTSLKSFNTEEWIQVTINDLDYRIYIIDADFVAAGVLASGMRWNLNTEGLLTVIGNGEMDAEGYYPWSEYRDDITVVNIQPGVKSIAEDAFREYPNLTSVTIPGSVTTIGHSAFYDCPKLQNVELTAGLKIIGEYAFVYNTALTELTLPDTVTELGANFIAGTAIKSIRIPKGVTDAERALSGAIELDQVTFAEGMKKIPSWMFDGDAFVYVSSLIIPESVTEIGEGAFHGCAMVCSVDLPDGLEKIGYEAFSGCVSLTKVTIPAAVKMIGDRAFSECTALAAVTMTDNNSYVRTPEGLKLYSLEIERRAFENCTALTALRLSKNVSKILEEAFIGCSALWELTLPENLKELGWGVFSGTKISSITVPAGLERASGAFEEMASLSEVIFAEGTITIPDNICSNYEGKTRIKNIVIPEGVKEISFEAFAKCTRLGTVNIPQSVSHIDEEAFLDCDVFFYLYQASYAEMWAIENGYKYGYLGAVTANDEDRILDMSFSTYYTNTDMTSVNSYLPIYVKYKVKKEDRALINDKKIMISLSPALDLVDGSLTIDEENLSNYDFDEDNNRITVWVEDYEGTLQLYVRPVSFGQIASYATFSCWMGNDEIKEVIGAFSLEIPMLTMQAPAKISKTSFEISGLTEPKAQVNLYLDDRKVTTLTARKDGAFSTSVNLPQNPVNGKTYQVKAELAKDSDVFTVSKVVYAENVPEVLAFEMYYTNHSDACLDLLATQGARQTISYLPGTPLTFKIRFSNADQLKRVFVGSRKGNVEKKMEAIPSGKSGEYVASGFFDRNDPDYLPGTIYVMYQTASTSYSEIGEVDFESDEVSEIWRNPVVNPTVNDDVNGRYEGTVTNNDGDTINYEIRTGTPGAISRYLLGDSEYDSPEEVINAYANNLNQDSEISIIARTADVLVYMKNDDSEVGYIFSENNGRKFWSEVIKGPVDKGLAYIFQNAVGLPKEAAGGLGTAIAGTLNAIYCGANTTIDINRAYSEIKQNASLSPEQKAEAYQTLQRMKTANAALSAFRIVNTAVKVGLTMTGHPIAAAIYGVFSSCLESIAQGYIDDSITYAKEGKIYSLKWLIDPSGYVYEAVTDNYIENATVTAWFKANEDDSPVIWDAEEDGQINPLYTDNNGFYAWDTPEGLWQVVVEKPGYETWTSEWLTVPPVQTDVNAALISLSDPFVEWYQVNEHQIEIKFSQFMDPESVKKIEVMNSAGLVMKYDLEYDTSRSSADGKVYADYYLFRFERNTLSEGERCSIIVPESVVNYAGKTIEAEEIRAVRTVNRVMTVQSNADIVYTKTAVIPVNVSNAGDDTIVTAESASPLIAKVVSVEPSDTEEGLWLVTAYGALPGTADIVISINNSAVSKVVTCNIINDGQASDVAEIESISVSAEKQSINVGETLQLSAKVLPENADDKTVIWATDKSSIAMIDSMGLLTALHTGTVQVVARALQGNAVAVYTVVIEEKHKHILELVPAIEPSFTSEGVKAHYKCTECGALFEDADGTITIEEKDTIIERLKHTPGEPVHENEVAATCTSEGSYDEVIYCVDCHEELSRSKKTIDRLDHTPETIPSKEATCIETGLTEGEKCSVCGEILKAQKVIPATGQHTWETVDAVPATCTEAGHTTGVKCHDCDEYLLKPETVPATGHSYKSTVKKATLKANGSITQNCEKCGAKGKVTTIKQIKTVSLKKTSYTYNGFIQKPGVTIKDSAGNAIATKYYTLTYSNKSSKAVGSYTVKVTFKGNYSGTKTLKYSIGKAKNPLKVKTTSKTYRQTALTAAKTFTIGASKGQGKVTYTLNAAAKKAKIKVSTAGKVTVPKKCKKGTYKITVKAAGNKNYKTGTKTVSITVK